MENYEAHILSRYSGGFHIAFENGLIVSVQWRPGTYTQNGREISDDLFERFDLSNPNQIQRSTDVEIALLDSNENFVDPRDYGIDVPDDWFAWGDVVAGHISMEELAEFIYRVSKAKVEG